MGKLRPGTGKGSNNSEIRTEPRLPALPPWTTCGPANGIVQSCAELDAWTIKGVGLGEAGEQREQRHESGTVEAHRGNST